MISWFNAPNEGLSPGGQLTLKTLTATENKTYSEEGTAYTSVTVNVEGGGGGDLTVANVTVTVIGQHYADLMGSCCYTEDDEYYSSAFLDQEVNKVILYKGNAMVFVNNLEGTISVSGNAVYDESSETIMVTGDCTITIS